MAGYYTAHARPRPREDVDLVVCLGDYIYEKRLPTTRPAPDTTGATATARRRRSPSTARKYALYHTDERPAGGARGSFPLLAIWDDHEVEDNYAGDARRRRPSDRRVPFARARAQRLPRVLRAHAAAAARAD